MKIDSKKLALFIIGTFVIACIPLLFVKTTTAGLVTSPLSPPDIVFPIAWSILYILMGISSYIVYEKTNKIEPIYITQLVVNAIWTILFFGLKLRLFSFFWILLLIGLVIDMISKFSEVDKKAGLMNIPYLLWLIFASYLNLAIYFLNK